MTDEPIQRASTDAEPVVTRNTDGREKWDWKTRYKWAFCYIRTEGYLLGAYLAVWATLSLVALAAVADFYWPGTDIDSAKILLRRHDVLVFFIGSLGSTVYAIKWLVHSVANGTWHQDRRLWRVFVPLTGGIYAVIVLGLIKAGLMGGGNSGASDPLARDLVLAFLAGYFSDGVSGLLTNIANAIFGKVDHK